MDYKNLLCDIDKRQSKTLAPQDSHTKEICCKMQLNAILRKLERNKCDPCIITSNKVRPNHEPFIVQISVSERVVFKHIIKTLALDIL